MADVAELASAERRGTPDAPSLPVGSRPLGSRPWGSRPWGSRPFWALGSALAAGCIDIAARTGIGAELIGKPAIPASLTAIAVSVLALAGLAAAGLAGAAVSRRRSRALQRGRASMEGLLDDLDRAAAQLATANDRARRAAGLAQVHTRLLQSRDCELRLQNARFDAALSNMSQALCMADAERNVIVCNIRFLEMFGLSPGLVRPGTAIADVYRAIAAIAVFNPRMVEALRTEQGALAAAHRAGSFVQEDGAGRALAVSQQPMEGGGWVATYEDVSERRQTEARISFLAHHDALTSLPNRRLFRERLEAELAAPDPAGETVALLCLDLDRFKDVNDTLGHSAGDALLEAVAQRLRGCVRESDLVARLGGDEFAILQRAAGQPAQAEALAQRICEAIGHPFDLDGQPGIVGVSIGIAIAQRSGAPRMDPRQAGTQARSGRGSDGTGEESSGAGADLLLKSADMALFRAKADGRGTWRFFEPEMDAQVRARRAVELDLREALERGQFELFYQPQFDLESSRVIGFEALLRWHHPERGMIPPGQFVPVAEQLLLIGPIGDWVLRQACADAASWPDHITVAVNLSPVQFRSDDLVGAVSRALGQSGLAPARLELEITETALLQETDAVISTLHRLRGLGVSVALDDFGTGYSSLSYLRSFPFDRLKIDQSFVRELGRRPDCRVIVASVANLARQLGMSTTAEGVETAAQIGELRQVGCSEAQGHYLGMPRPFAETLRWFASEPGMASPELAPA